MSLAGNYERVQVLEAHDETAALRAIRIQLGKEQAAGHSIPGQVVKVRTPPGEGYFALASAPSPDGRADLLMKRGGRIADAAIEAGQAGGSLELSHPFGKGFPVREAEGKDVLLFAAGSAIAPIRALIQHLLAHRVLFNRLTLFYGQRRGADFAFRREYADWERGGLRVVLCPSAEADAWPGVRGRVQEVARALAFGGAPPGETVAFVCGMGPMVDDVRATLAAAGVPPERVHVNF